MANLVTLASVTLARPIGRDDSEVFLSSLSGLKPGQRLYVDRESMEFIRDLGDRALVGRGRDGTGAATHANGSVVWVANPNELYEYDPQGLPPTELLVSPWINVRTGDVFFAQGDAVGAGASTIQRHWVKQITTWTPGALGIVTVTQDPVAST